MAFSFLLVDYKSIQTTLAYIKLCQKYLKSCEASSYIIVDNTEDGQALAYIKEHCQVQEQLDAAGYQVTKFIFDNQEVFITAIHENAGYAKGNNIAAAISTVLFPDNHFIVSNNDIIFEKEYDLDKVLSQIKENDYAIIGPNVLDTDGTSINPFNRPDTKFILYTLFLNTILPKKIQQRQNDEMYTFSGCFWIFNREYYNKAKGFDERTFLYFEEQIISERIQSIGGKLHYMEDFEVIHNHVNSKRTPLRDSKMLRVFYKSMRIYADDYLHIGVVSKVLSRMAFEVTNFFYIIERCILYVVK